MSLLLFYFEEIVIHTGYELASNSGKYRKLVVSEEYAMNYKEWTFWCSGELLLITINQSGEHLTSFYYLTNIHKEKKIWYQIQINTLTSCDLLCSMGVCKDWIHLHGTWQKGNFMGKIVIQLQSFAHTLAGTYIVKG